MIKILLLLTLSFLFLFSCSPANIVIEPQREKVVKPIQKKPIQKVRKKKFKPIIQKKSYLKDLTESNLVKIGLIEGKQEYTISIDGEFKFSSNNNKIFNFKKQQSTFKISYHNNQITLFNIRNNQKLIALKNLVITPLSIEDRFNILSYKSKNRWQKIKKSNYSFKGELLITVVKNKLYLVNHIPVEEYIKGVIPTEMHPASPLEALKAQAVVARTNVYSTLGRKYKNKPYNLSNNVYSQVYGGAGREVSRSNLAVKLTKGEIVTFHNTPIEAVFHSTSGGFIESNNHVWSGKARPYLVAKLDSPIKYKNFQNLSSEKNFKRFINSKPAVYCNMTVRKFPSQLNYAKKYFRWRKTISRVKLEKHLRRITGINVGTIKNIYILKRGKSGKALKARVVGTKRNLTITKELNIRKKLGSPSLYSANFYIIRGRKDKNGFYKNFTYKGAGFGHGCGMSQISAIGMALDGLSYKKILKFYYPHTKITIK